MGLEWVNDPAVPRPPIHMIDYVDDEGTIATRCGAPFHKDDQNVSWFLRHVTCQPCRAAGSPRG